MKKRSDREKPAATFIPTPPLLHKLCMSKHSRTATLNEMRTTQPAHLHRHEARIALVAVGAVQREDDAHSLIILKCLAFPHSFVKALNATMEAVGPVVGRQCVVL